jgi:long-chain fatty acid transport protein
MNNLKVGMDIRWINWKNAKGYKEFQWNDQWVIALGGEFKPMQKLALRAGYNYGKSPIRGGTKEHLRMTTTFQILLRPLAISKSLV